MVLRKPYKFFIKHFKLFHLILSALVIYSLVRITNVINYINSFTNSDVTLKTISVADFNSLYSAIDFIVPIAAMILSIILLVVMTMKKKANKFYAYSTVVSLVVLIVNIYGRNTMLDLTTTWLTKGTLETVVDIYIFVIIACVVEVAIALSRAIGFNISRFDFNSDILEFDLDEKDNEEFEVAVDFDINDVKRDVQKRTRYVKYFFKENKSTLLWTSVIVVAFLALFGIYSLLKGTVKAEPLKNLNRIGLLSFSVNDIYIIDKDPNGKDLPDGLNLIVLDAIIENKTKNDLKLNASTMTINIGEDSYGRKTEYANYVSDLGTLYYNDDIKKNSTVQRLFVFAIPKRSARKKMYLGVGNTYYKIKPQVISTEDNVIENKLNEELNFEGSSVGDSKIKITEFDVKDVIEVPYKFKNMNSVETLVPTYTGNNDNTILKLKGEFTFDENSKSKNLASLISKYGYIEYEIDGKQYKQSSGFSEIKSKKVNDNTTYYIEVNSSIAKASKIVLGFRLRYADYKYYLKGSA